MAEYARWYKPVVILNGLVFLVFVTALISGGENGEIIGTYAGLIAVILFGIWFWHMKSIQAKSLEDDTKYHNQPYQEEILTSCTKCGTKDSKILGGLCSACLKQKEGKEREQKVDPKKVNYYQLLDVKENASQDEIKKKWKVLAKEFHPDINDSTIAQDEGL